MQRFWWNSRFGQIDMLLTACLTVGLYAFWRYENTRRYAWLSLFYLAALAGLFSKGPGVLVFPVLFVLVWTWRSNLRREAWIHLFIGCVFCVLVYAAWVIPFHMTLASEAREATGDALASNMFRQTFGRFFLGVSHANWPWYYLTTLPVDWLPWTLFLPWVILWTWRHWRDNLSVKFLLCWTVPLFLFFSAAIGKRGVYLLPLFPAFSMLFAVGVLDFMENSHSKWQRRIGVLYALILLILGLAPSFPAFDRIPGNLEPGTDHRRGVYCRLRAIDAFLRRKKGYDVSAHPCARILRVRGVVLCPLRIPGNQHSQIGSKFAGRSRSWLKKGSILICIPGFTREEYVFYSRHFQKELFTEIIELPHGITCRQCKS